MSIKGNKRIAISHLIIFILISVVSCRNETSQQKSKTEVEVIFVCSADLSDKDDIVAQTFRKSIYSYLGSNKFDPKEKTDADMLINILYKGSANVQI